MLFEVFEKPLSAHKSMAHKQRNLRETFRKQSGNRSAQVVEKEEERKDAD